MLPPTHTGFQVHSRGQELGTGLEAECGIAASLLCGWGSASCLPGCTLLQLLSWREVVLVLPFLVRKLMVRRAVPHRPHQVCVCACPRSHPQALLHVTFVCWLFPACFVTGSAYRGCCHWCLPNRRAPTLSAHTPCCPHGRYCGMCVPTGLGQGRTFLCELFCPYEHNHFIYIWNLWPPPWPLPSDTQVIVALWSLG